MPDNKGEAGKRRPGRWPKGTSGNPGGRPAIPPDVRQASRALTQRAIATLAAALDAPDPRARIAAAVALLDRAWGRPAQAITADVAVSAAPAFDPEKLSDDELRALIALLQKSRGAEAPALPPAPVSGPGEP